MMRRLSRLIWISSLLFAASVAQAQPPAEEEEPVEPAPEDEAWAEGEEDEEPRLRPPQTESLRLGSQQAQEALDEEEEVVEEEEAEDEALPSPAEAQSRLDAAAEDSSDVTAARWTTPQTVVDLHGYMRFRGEFQDNFFMNRQLEGYRPENGLQDARNVILPWSVWLPYEDGVLPAGGCDGASDKAPCDQHALAYATMRLRLEPTIHLSDDVRVRMQLDVFDNMVLGSTPNSFAVGPAAGSFNPYYRYERTIFAPIDTLSTTLEPPTFGYNSLQDSIRVRRAWAEVRNRGLGELRFGRMGDHWGLGILANGGSGIDADYQTDVDRIMLSTRLAGIYIFGAWDFAAEGLLYSEPADVGGLAFDRSRVDDVDQFVVGAAYRMTEEEQTAALQRGDAVFNVGARFVYRSQNLSSAGTTNPFGLCVICNEDGELVPGGAERRTGPRDPVFVRRGADIFIPDVWMQFMYEKLRLELEAVFVYGTIDNLSNTNYNGSLSPGGERAATLLQFGFAFEGEYRLLNDQLGIHFASGFATGDQDVEGLDQFNGLQRQLPTPGNPQGDRTYSSFAFHPNYRIDLIFWRNVMRQISGAYYFRPGISYDFIRNSFGQLLGARADVVWSRASEPIQTWGNADDLGVEIDVSVYYRSEDGPDILDGFYAQAQWGIFFPLDGLGYLPGTPNAPSLGNAQTFRLLLGVMY